MRRLAALLAAVLAVSCGGGEEQGSGDDDGSLFPGDTWQWEEGVGEDKLGVDTAPDDSILVPDGADVVLPDLPGDTATDNGPVTPDWTIKFASPQSGPVSGMIRVRIESGEKDELKVDSIAVYLSTSQIFRDTKLPTEFFLDTRAHPDGDYVLKAEATIGDESTTAQISISWVNPQFAVRSVSANQTEVKDGTVVNLEVEAALPGLQVAADFSQIDSSYGPALGQMTDLGNGMYTLSYKISDSNTKPDGTYSIPVTAMNGSDSVSSDHLKLVLLNAQQTPVTVQGGIFVPGSMPNASSNWQQPISLVYGNSFIITGGSATINVDFSGYSAADEIVGILIGVEGASGYYQKPVAGSLGEEELLLLMRTYEADETPPNKLNLLVAVKDIRGRISPTRIHKMSVQAVGSGDVQVSISWDSATDVDLHVIEPTGCEMYYGKKTCASGGYLDLDSNAGCMIDNINNENVFWPPGKAPTGTFQVKVDFYDDCGTFGPGKPANYAVTVHYCGKTELFNGSFAAGTDDAGGAGSGKLVATFNNELCGKLLSGRVRFQDHTIDKDGTGPWRWKPVRFATVEVVRASDETVLATTYTDRLGNYQVYFTNAGAPGVYVRVRTKTNYDDGLRKITVMNHPKFKKIYSVKSDSIDESAATDPVINIDVPVSGNSGAFNVLDVVCDGYDTIRLMTGTDLGELTVFWATGADTTDTLFCSQYFYDEGSCSELHALSVQGKDTDRDEFDDMVILKEFFKFALALCSRDDNPGGYHDGTRDDPRRSWTEGVSTFFPADALKTRFFVNSRPFGVYLVVDLETPNIPFALKAVPGVMDGDLSEYLVSSLLWDLADANDSESFDNVEGKRLPIYDSVFNYLSGASFQDRGVEGVDLVDFLDGWFCRAWGDNINVMKLLQDHYLFGYEMGGPTNCFSGQ